MSAGAVDIPPRPLDAATVLLPFAMLFGLLLVDFNVPPGPHSRADAIRTLAQTRAVALVASARCADLFANTEIDQMQAALGLTGADSAEVLDLERRLASDMVITADKAGVKTWCGEVYGRFGPDGTMMKGLLKRCDANSNGC